MRNALVFIFCLSSCLQIEKEEFLSAKDYYNKAVRYHKKGNSSEALKALDSLDKNKSYSQYTSLSKLLRADIYFKQKRYPSALKAYKVVKDLHPGLSKSKVLFKIGLCHLKTLPSHSNTDLSKADKAIFYFKEVLKLKKKDSYHKKAQENLKFLFDLKAKKELDIALFYKKRNHSEASLLRLKNVIKNNPKNSYEPQILWEAYLLSEKLKKPSQTFKQRLIKEFPQSKETGLLKGLKK